MSILGKLLGSDTAINKTIETVANGFDKLHYGSQEKAEDDAKDRSEARGMLIDWIKSTSGQNLARRILALSISGTWLFQFILSKFCSILSIFYPGQMITTTVTTNGIETVTSTPAIQMAADRLLEGANDMTAAVTLILVFYFAAPHLDKAISPIIDKLLGGFKKK